MILSSPYSLPPNLIIGGKLSEHWVSVFIDFFSHMIMKQGVRREGIYSFNILQETYMMFVYTYSPEDLGEKANRMS